MCSRSLVRSSSRVLRVRVGASGSWSDVGCRSVSSEVLRSAEAGSFRSGIDASQTRR
jgi:hypothetical protein